MKIIKISLIALIVSLATMQPIMYAMENSPKPHVAQQNNTLLDYEKQQRELFRAARQCMEKNDRQKAAYQERNLNYLQNLSKELGKPDINLLRDRMTDTFEDKMRTKKRKINYTVFKNSPKVNQNDQDKRTSYSEEKPTVHEPMENEITNLIPLVQIESRSSLLENSEKATIKIVADLIENTTPEVKVENRPENAASLEASQLVESNSSFSDSQWEDFFPIPSNLSNQATNNANNNPIATGKIEINTNASSTINSSTSENNEKLNNAHEGQNQLPSKKRTEQIVKIAPLLIEKFNKDSTQPISVQKPQTQEEIIARAHAMATQLEQSVDTLLIDVYDKYVSSIKSFEEKTKEKRKLFGQPYKQTQNDVFNIKKFIESHQLDFLLSNRIKNYGLQITDPVEKMKLKKRLSIIADKVSCNYGLMQKLLDSFIQEKQHQTATIISHDISINEENTGQLLFDKIAKVIKEGSSDKRTGYWTSTKNCQNNSAQERSNPIFEGEYSIAYDQAQKYLLDQLPQYIKETQATLSTDLTRAKIGF